MTDSLAAPRGLWRFTELTPDGPEVSPWYENTVQIRAYDLSAALLVGQVGYAGMQYIEVGSGDAGWDSLTLPFKPTVSESALVSPLARVPISNHHFLTGEIDPATGNYVTQVGISRFMLIDAFVPINTGVGTWREMAIVGGTATETLGSGLYLTVLRRPALARPIGSNPIVISVALYL